MEVFIAIGVIVLAALAAAGAFHRPPKVRPLTPAERRFLERSLPWLAHLDLSLRAAWERQVARFLATTAFEGCGELAVTAEMRLLVAGQACLLALGRETRPFTALKTVLIYPSAFWAPTSQALGSHASLESKEERIGESWERGQVVLAWDEIDPAHADPDLAGNLVYHEFAHQLDAENGEDDGVPVLSDELAKEWPSVMGREYRRLQRAAQSSQEPFLDPYGAESPAEFFAVATEAYFEEGEEMEKRHPDLYRILKAFYRVDGASLGQRLR